MQAANIAKLPVCEFGCMAPHTFKVCCSVLQCVTVCCTVLKGVTLCHNVLQCVAY